VNDMTARHDREGAPSVRFNPKALLVTGASLALLWLALAQGFSLLTIAIDVAVGWGLWAVPANWLQRRAPAGCPPELPL
jgi:hypothetical protein